MLASIQILIHLTIFLFIVVYKHRCKQENYRASAGFLAFLIGGFNIGMVGYLIMIQPNHADVYEYLHLVVGMVTLATVAHFRGSTSQMIDAVTDLAMGDE